MAIRQSVMVAIEVGADPEKNLTRMKRHVEIGREIDEVLDEKASDNSRHNKRLKDLREEERRIRNALDTGVETIHVDCYERINEQLMQVETVRKDTEQVLPNLTRPMNAEERQLGLDVENVEPRNDVERAETEDAGVEEPPKKKRGGRRKKSEETAEEAAE